MDATANVQNDRASLRVAVNLTRLVPAASGAGGAGWFALHCVLALAPQVETAVFVNKSNVDWIARELSPTKNLLFHVFDGDIEEKGPRVLEDYDVYLDPLNGLEPKTIPASTIAITTIHDLLFLDHPEFFEQAELDWRSANYGSAIERADLVLTVSAQQAQRIRELYGKASVSAILQPPYFSPNNRSPAFVHSGLTEIFFYPSVQWNHKNHFRLYKAFLHLCGTGEIPDTVRLLVSGIVPVEANTSLHRAEAAADPNGDRIVELPYLNRSEYESVLNAASGIIYPSIYEGYGIPVVESLLNGLPVLTAEVPAFETLRRRPDHLHIISDPTNEALLAAELKSFILTAKRVPPDSGTCAVSIDAFNAQIVEAVRLAGLQKPTLTTAAPPAARAKRFKRGVTVHVLVTDSSELQQVDQCLSRVAARGVQVICYARAQDARSLTASGANERQVRYSYYLPHAAGLDNSLLYNLLFSQTDVACVLPYHPEIADDVARLESIADLIRIEGYPTAAKLGRPGRTTGQNENSLSDLLLDLVFCVARHPLPIAATQIEARKRVLAFAAQATLIGGSRFLIVDPALRDTVGHHFGVAQNMIRGSSGLGLRPVVLANWSCSATIFGHESEVRACFSDYLYSGIGDIGLFLHELEGVLSSLLPRADDVVTLFCATPAMLAGSAGFLAKIPQSARPTIIIRFDRDESRTPRCGMTYRQAFALIEAMGLSRFYRFFAESAGLQAYFEELSGYRFPLLFNPRPSTDDAFTKAGFVPARSESSEKHDAVTIGYLGEARAEKGFQLLPALIRRMRDATGPAAEAGFFIQTGASAQNDFGPVRTARAELEELASSNPKIRLVESLPGSEYDRALRSVDVLLLPYDVQSYTRRGSGVATEALAAGKVFVAPRGTDIADTFAGAGMVEAASLQPRDISAALVRAIDELESLQRKARQFQLDHPEYVVDARQFVERIVGVSHYSRPTTAAKARFALWISNDTRGQGSQSVYDAQIDYLQSRGFTLVKLYIPYPNRHNADNRASFDWGAFLERLEWTPGFVPSDEYYAIADSVARCGNSYNLFLSAWRHLEFSPPLRAFIRSLDFDLVVVNYAHHRAVLDTLDLDVRCPIVVETHDIQAHQYAIQQGREVSEVEVLQEMNALATFDHVVSISASEAKVFATYVGSEKVSWALPPGRPIDVIRGEEPLLNPRDVDILIVGSEHDANVASINWFLREVYRVYLYPHGVTLRIVGSVCNRLDRSLMGDRVDYAGIVRFLDPHYASARVVALPVITGAGVPIKILDAFAHGAAFSMTAFAAPALDITDEVPMVSTAQEMAEDINALLESKSARRDRANVGRQYYMRRASRRAYFQTWDAIAAAIGMPVEGEVPDADEGLPPVRLRRNFARIHSIEAPSVVLSTVQRKTKTAARILKEKVRAK